MRNELFHRIAIINREHSLDIRLDTIEELYGSYMIDQMAENIDDVLYNIEYLISLGFGEDVADICNGFGILLCYDPADFSERVGELVRSLGDDYVEKMGEDMSYWESIL